MKGIKTLFGVLAVASLLFSTQAFAQENNNRDQNGNIARGSYETNKAFDNTFIGVGVGYNAGVSQKMVFRGGGLGVDLYAGKWFTPFVGARAGYKGISAYNGEFSVKPNQHYLHADFLWGLTNSIWGYQETRCWNVNPYVSAGVLAYAPKAASNSLEFALGAGFQNTFRMSDRVNLVADLSILATRASQYEAKDRLFFPLSATVGLSFNLGKKTGFDRHSSITPVVIPVPFTTAQYNSLKDQVAALEQENAGLKDQVNALEKELAPVRELVSGQTYLFENGTFTAVDFKATPITLYFDCGSAKLSAREKAHLEYFLQNAVDENTKLEINGYADKQTGNARINQKLSEQRVNAVVELLKKAGASEANIVTAAHGSDVQPFDAATKNRVVTIEVK